MTLTEIGTEKTPKINLVLAVMLLLFYKELSVKRAIVERFKNFGVSVDSDLEYAAVDPLMGPTVDYHRLKAGFGVNVPFTVSPPPPPSRPCRTTCRPLRPHTRPMAGPLQPCLELHAPASKPADWRQPPAYKRLRQGARQERRQQRHSRGRAPRLSLRPPKRPKCMREGTCWTRSCGPRMSCAYRCSWWLQCWPPTCTRRLPPTWSSPLCSLSTGRSWSRRLRRRTGPPPRRCKTR